MPKLTHHPSVASHHQGYSNSLTVSLAPSPAMFSYNTRPQPGYYTDMSATGPQPSMSMPSFDYNVPNVPPLSIPTTGGMGNIRGPLPQAATPHQHRASSGAWTREEDKKLMSARAAGQNWSKIQENHFPGKSSNACRKRHERLMERRGANDWDKRKEERLAKEYMSLRREIWTPLAQRTGEKWNVVEQKCMSSGLKNLQSASRAGARRERFEAGQPHAGYDDDSGISGIGLTPVDDLDAPYGSPGEASSSTGGSSSGAPPHPAYSNAMHHSAAAGYPAAYAYNPGPQHGYTSSVSSSGTAGFATGPGPHGSQSASPYMGHGHRATSVDMGIGALINPGPKGRSGPVQ